MGRYQRCEDLKNGADEFFIELRNRRGNTETSSLPELDKETGEVGKTSIKDADENLTAVYLMMTKAHSTSRDLPWIEKTVQCLNDDKKRMEEIMAKNHGKRKFSKKIEKKNFKQFASFMGCFRRNDHRRRSQ